MYMYACFFFLFLKRKFLIKSLCSFELKFRKFRTENFTFRKNLLAKYCNSFSVPNCPTFTYQCPDSIECISRGFLCDNEEDCPGGEDESDCHGKLLGYVCLFFQTIGIKVETVRMRFPLRECDFT